LIEDARINYIARDYPGEPTQAEMEKNLKGVITDWSSHPAVWGYNILDEPGASKFPRLAYIMNYLKTHDPKRVGVINLLPTYASQELIGRPSYSKYVEDYLNTVKPSFLGWDNYELYADGGMRGEHFLNLELCRKAALAHNLPMLYTFLSMPHGPYADPTEAQLRWQIYTGIAYGAKGLIYYQYFVPTFAPPDYRDGLVDRTGNLTSKYYYAKKINAEIMALSPLLMKLKSIGVYHAGDTLETGTKPLPVTGKFFVKNVSGGRFVVGFFKSAKKSNYLMIVNKDYKNTQCAAITFSGKIDVYAVNRKDSSKIKLAVKNNNGDTTCKINLAAGDAALLQVN
jgi:hypothetical protein